MVGTNHKEKKKYEQARIVYGNTLEMNKIL